MKLSKRLFFGLYLPGFLFLLAGIAYFIYWVVFQGRWDDTLFRLAIIVMVFMGWTFIVLGDILKNQINNAEAQREILQKLNEIEAKVTSEEKKDA